MSVQKHEDAADPRSDEREEPPHGAVPMAAAVRCKSEFSEMTGRTLKLTQYEGLAELPHRYRSLFEATEEYGLFYSLPWYETLLKYSSRPGDRLRIYAAETDDDACVPVGLLVARSRDAVPGRFSARRLAGFSNNYTVEFDFLVRPEFADPGSVVRTIVAGISGAPRRWDVVSLRCLNRDSQVFRAIVGSFRDVGWIVHTYFQFGNWYEGIEGKTFDEYLKARGSNIRHSQMRRVRKLKRSGRLHYKLYTSTTDLAAALKDYHAIYSSSWKEPEEFPEFVPALIRAAAENGFLRLGIVYWDDKPAAMHLSFVVRGVATMYKTAYDEQFRELGAGSVANLSLMQGVIDDDHCAVIDFGIGDDGYKSQWLSQRREIWGIMAFNPRTAQGLLLAFRHKFGPVAKAAMRRVLGRG